MSDTKLSAAKPADNRDLRFVFFVSSRLLVLFDSQKWKNPISKYVIF